VLAVELTVDDVDIPVRADEICAYENYLNLIIFI